MHVGFVIYGDLEQTSGGYRYDRTLVSALEKRGDDVDVISIPPRSYPRALLDGFSRSLRERLDRPYDVLLQDELCHPSLWLLNSRLERPASIVSIVHLLRSDGEARRIDPVHRTVERRYLETADAAICTSRDTRDRTKALAELPTIVAPPAGRVGDAGVPPVKVHQRATKTDEPLRVAFVGNVIPRKRTKTVVSALERADCDWQLTVVGSLENDPEYARSVTTNVRDSGVEERVSFAGRVTDSELESVLERSHVLAVPSRYEGFGMVYLEAMEYGVVPIASAVGGASEFVDHGENGFLVEPDDPRAIASIVERLEDDRDHLSRMGTSALETAADHPTWTETTARVRSFLLERGTETNGATASGPTAPSKTDPESEV